MVQERVQAAREPMRYRQISQDTSSANLVNLRQFKVAKVDFIANGSGNTYVFTWQNPENNIIIVREVIVRITVAGGTALAVLDVGVVANATSTASLIFDGVDLNATGVFSSQILADTGTNGLERPNIVQENGGSSDWITGYEQSNNAYSNLVGAVYIFYTGVV